MSEPHRTVAGVRFRNAGKIFYFDAAGMRLEVGEYVVVETARGPEVGRVVISPDQVLIDQLGHEELKPLLRLATEEDIERADNLRTKAQEILLEARAIAQDAGFPARLDTADFTLDGRRLTFSFTSEERLDYRDLVRQLNSRFDAKVDLRQVGARDRAKAAGGYGICGRELCCSNWLTTFPSISIRMAKEQDLPLNPQKISGLCGRLLCCLSYEEEGYKEMRRTLPKLGQRCSTPTGEGRVVALNILRRQVTLLLEGKRVEVPDRDLGLVVRWDTASKAGDPPPSISRAEAIAQGLIEATEEDLAAGEDGGDDWMTGPHEPGPGRGRLPAPAPRREIRSKPRADAPVQGQRERPQGRQAGQVRRGGGQPNRQGPPPRGPEGARARPFRRAGDAPASAPNPPTRPPSNEQAAEGEQPAGRRRRGRRGGRGRGGNPSQGESGGE